MKIRVTKAGVADIVCDVLVVNLFEKVKKPAGATGLVDKALGGLISDIIKSGEADGKLGQTTLIHSQGKVAAKRVLVVGLGPQKDFGGEEVRLVTSAALRAARQVKAKKVATILHGAGAGGLDLSDASQALTEGALIGLYHYEGYKSKNGDDKERGSISELVVVERDPQKVRAIQKGIQAGQVVSDAVNRVRDIVNTPSNKKTPIQMAAYARTVIQGTKIRATVLDGKTVKRMGMGGFYGVAQGSDEPCKLVVLKYQGGSVRDPWIGLVGKGITFDTGGISIKPARNMLEMKTDMAGAATVINTIRAAADLNLKVNVLGVTPFTENMPSGHAYKPSDVVKTLSGKTVEIVNTDAEGRMILCDALTYAVKLGATKIIDLATLTGACVVCLGDVAVGLMTNQDDWGDQVLKASEESGEKMWKLPLYKEFREYLKSDVADLINCTEHGKAGTSVAGVFLKEFVGETPWVHLDIAGTAWQTGSGGYLSRGATGVGLRTLVALLRSMAA